VPANEQSIGGCIESPKEASVIELIFPIRIKKKTLPNK
jgi:hypothetical protein